MPGEPIIDLDYADVLEEQERPPRTMAAHLRMAAAVSLVLACLLLLGGADLPPRGFSSGNSRTSVAETVGFDPATGQKLWRVEDEVRRVGDLFMASGDAPDGGQIARVYRSLPDGLLWTTPPVRMMTADPATDALMTVADDGTFTEYALSTGAVRKTGRIEPPEAAAEEESVGLRVLWQPSDRLFAPLRPA